jgi:beta-glucosidase
VPVNEPNVATFNGYALGEHAPGRTMNFDAICVAHHLLLGHGRAAIELRRAGATSVGCANNHSPMWPASDDPADVGTTKLFDALWNGVFTEAMLLGRYPLDIYPLLEPWIKDGDMATIRQPVDFYGVNYYNPLRVAANLDPESDNPFEFVDLVGYETTDFGWPVVPDALREWLIILRARYRAALPPIIITESGCSYGAGPDADGVVDDQARVDYLDAHLRAVATAIQQGVDVRGYYTWSLMDNFEWAEGFSQRFGLVHVDFETLERTPKKSFHWFAEMIRAQGASQDQATG